MCSRNSLDSLILRLSGVLSATVKSKGETSQEPRRLPGKPSLPRDEDETLHDGGLCHSS